LIYDFSPSELDPVIDKYCRQVIKLKRFSLGSVMGVMYMPAFIEIQPGMPAASLSQYYDAMISYIFFKNLCVLLLRRY
jgi:hypothetical protein